MQEELKDIEIIKGLKTGESEAYKYLYKTLYGLMCAFARDYVQDAFVAETIVADVIFEIWKNRATLEIDYSLRNYLLASVRHRCINWIHQHYKELEVRTKVAEQMEQREREEEESHPLASLIAKELDLKIKSSLDSMPEQTRTIFTLSRFHHMKYEDISTALNVSVDVVKYHIKSALSRLRADLKGYC